jgi:hypothetical protein
LLNVDSAPDQATLDRLLAEGDIYAARVIKL